MEIRLGSYPSCPWATADLPNTILDLMGIADLSSLSYPGGMGGMKGITIKLPEAVARQLREQARESGRSVAAIIRERIEVPPRDGQSVYAASADLAGSLAGGRMPATNARKRFRRP
jgi:predicted DNA-binding protein